MRNANAAMRLDYSPAPTEEQLRIVDCAKTGADFKIMAYAGAGKTSTLTQIANALPPYKKGQYIAFNKEIVTDASTKFPSSVRCSTAHGLAFGAVGRMYVNRLNQARTPPELLAEHFDVSGIDYKKDGEKNLFALPPGKVVLAALATLQNFVKSAATEPHDKHVTLPAEFSRGGIDFEQKTYRYNQVKLAKEMWADLQSKEGVCRFTHDHYLKIWQLSDPVINKDYILFDEAQDADPVMLDIVKRQQCQKIICGDSYQSIYEWRGAVDALSIALRDKQTLHLTKSFRFGNAIAAAADEILDILGAKKPITGIDCYSALSEMMWPKAILCRTNGGVIESLITAIVDGKRASVVGDTAPLVTLINGCESLRVSDRSTHPELAGFESWDELKACIELGEEDLGSLPPVVRLIEKYSAQALTVFLSKTVPENRADVVISTAHRAKGREWDSVRIADDFKSLREMKEQRGEAGNVTREMQVPELKLAYVAVTRARQKLDLSPLLKRG